MPVELTSRQLDIFSDVTNEALASSLAVAANTLRPDIADLVAAQHERGLKGWTKEAVDQAYDADLSRKGDLAAYIAVLMCEVPYSKNLPDLFAQIEQLMDLDERGDLLLALIEDRIAAAAENASAAQEMADFVQSMRGEAA